jgi:hypothetical protein
MTTTIETVSAETVARGVWAFANNNRAFRGHAVAFDETWLQSLHLTGTVEVGAHKLRAFRLDDGATSATLDAELTVLVHTNGTLTFAW